MKSRTLRKNKRTIRRTIRKLYTGGFKIGYNCSSRRPRKEYIDLIPYIKSPYKWTTQPYSGGGCDMYIWKGKTQNPHIHIHGFNNGSYEFTISAKNKRNVKAILYSKLEHGYESALTQMYNALEDTNRKIPALTTPSREKSIPVVIREHIKPIRLLSEFDVVKHDLRSKFTEVAEPHHPRRSQRIATRSLASQSMFEEE